MSIPWGWITVLLLVAAGVAWIYERSRSQPTNEPAKAGFFSSGGLMSFLCNWFCSSKNAEIDALRAQVSELMQLLYQPSNPAASVPTIAVPLSAASAIPPPIAKPTSGGGTTSWTPADSYPSAAELVAQIQAHAFPNTVQLDGRPIADGVNPPSAYFTCPDGSVRLADP